jgi:hypothetical protein
MLEANLIHALPLLNLSLIALALGIAILLVALLEVIDPIVPLAR